MIDGDMDDYATMGCLGVVLAGLGIWALLGWRWALVIFRTFLFVVSILAIACGSGEDK